jgi:thiol-disulfide isomerase/thioredoxin
LLYAAHHEQRTMLNAYMKLLFSCCILFLSISAFAEKATVHITVRNFSGSVSVRNPQLRYYLTKDDGINLPLDAHHTTSYTIDIDKPGCITLRFFNKTYNYDLFLSPGDELFLTADFSRADHNITVSGRGSNNNQPEIFALTNMDTKALDDDKTPDRVIAAINKQYLYNKAALARYIKVNKPTGAFIKNARANLQYFALYNFYNAYRSNIYGKPKEHEPKWQKILDSLFSAAKMSNDAPSVVYNYTRLMDQFPILEAGQLWNEYRNNPDMFFKQWFHTNKARGEKLFNEAQLGILIEKVIKKYFTGQAAEYAYGNAIKYVYFHEKDYLSAVLLFNHFKKKYPQSVYLKGFSGPIAAVVDKQKQALSNKIVFVKNNGAKLNTFKEVLALTKGKTVFIDMWGTWCGPCREEIEKYAAKLRANFAGKNITFLYIANFDSTREKEWKKQIAYFQMEGMHILAKAKLTNDIMVSVKASGYPTYIIIKKDGSYKQTTTKYPMNLQAMIREIQAAIL